MLIQNQNIGCIKSYLTFCPFIAFAFVEIPGNDGKLVYCIPALPTIEEKQEVDARSVYVGNVR